MQEYGEYRSMVSAHRCYLRSRGHVSGHHHGNKGGFHAGVDPRPFQSGWMGVNGAVCFGLSPIPRGGPKSVCDATFLDRQCRHGATDGGDLYPDGGYALASIYRDLGFFHHDSRHADFHRDRVFESQEALVAAWKLSLAARFPRIFVPAAVALLADAVRKAGLPEVSLRPHTSPPMCEGLLTRRAPRGPGKFGTAGHHPVKVIRGPLLSPTPLDPEPTAQTDHKRKFDLTSSVARADH